MGGFSGGGGGGASANTQTVTNATAFTPANATQALITSLAFNGSGVAQRLNSTFVIATPAAVANANGFGITLQLRIGAVILGQCTAAFNVNGALHSIYVARNIAVNMSLEFLSNTVSGRGDITLSEQSGFGGLQTATGLLASGANAQYLAFANSIATPTGNFTLDLYGADATAGVNPHCQYVSSSHFLERA